MDGLSQVVFIQFRKDYHQNCVWDCTTTSGVKLTNSHHTANLPWSFHLSVRKSIVILGHTALLLPNINWVGWKWILYNYYSLYRVIVPDIIITYSTDFFAYTSNLLLYYIQWSNVVLKMIPVFWRCLWFPVCHKPSPS